VTLGQELAVFVREMIATDGLFGSTMTWRHIVRTEVAATGVVSEVATDESFRGAVIDPVRTKLFADATVAQASTAVIVPAGVLATDPKVLDQVAVRAGRWLRVLEVKELLGPGDGGEPVLVAVVAAVGA
jgi:hypothetical protein